MCATMFVRPGVRRDSDDATNECNQKSKIATDRLEHLAMKVVCGSDDLTMLRTLVLAKPQRQSSRDSPVENMHICQLSFDYGE